MGCHDIPDISTGAISLIRLWGDSIFLAHIPHSDTHRNMNRSTVCIVLISQYRFIPQFVSLLFLPPLIFSLPLSHPLSFSLSLSLPLSFSLPLSLPLYRSVSSRPHSISLFLSFSLIYLFLSLLLSLTTPSMDFVLIYYLFKCCLFLFLSLILYRCCFFFQVKSCKLTPSCRQNMYKNSITIMARVL